MSQSAAVDERRSDLPQDLNVELLRWPADRERREELRRLGRPRLLLLGPDDLPPGQSDQEDWIRLPADERDLSARLHRLAQQVVPPHDLRPGDVFVDDGGLVRWNGRYTPMSPTEAAIVRRLAETPGQLVSRAELGAVVWGGEARQTHSLDSRIFTVRRRLATIGLALHTKRGHGFILTLAPEDG